jgi:hypothetical protein
LVGTGMAPAFPPTVGTKSIRTARILGGI